MPSDSHIPKFGQNETWASLEPQVVRGYLNSLAQKSANPLDIIPLDKFVSAVVGHAELRWAVQR